MIITSIFNKYQIYYTDERNNIMTKHGWIVYNGNLPGTKFSDFAHMIQKAATKKGSQTTLIKNNHIYSLIGAQPDPIKLIYDSDYGPYPDYVVFTDKDIYLAQQLERLKIPVFNTAHAIAVSDDKIATYQALAAKGLQIPKTIIAPKTFIKNYSNSIQLESIIQHLGLPLIIKEAFGSFGEQVYLIHTRQELKKKVNQLAGIAFMFQEFIDTSYGRDLRLQVVGNQVIAAMERNSKVDFRANITAGGSTKPYQSSQLEEELAIAGAKAVGADFAGVDLLFGKDGPIICEINSNAHIQNLLDCTGVNAATHMIDYILKKLGT